MTRSVRKIVFYSDGRLFGGHELMTLAAANAIRAFYPAVDILWLLSDDNKRLLERVQQSGISYSFLKSTPRERLLKHPFAILRALLANTRKIRHFGPDIVIVAQGIVTFSFLGSLAARMAGAGYCCYQPTGGLASERDPKHASSFIDSVWRFCFRHIRNFITVDEEQKRLIGLHSPNATIRTVENFVPECPGHRCSREQSRRAWGISADKPVIGVVGRISFQEKNQGWLLEQVAADPFWKDYNFIIVGDGPDSGQLVEMCHKFSLGEQVQIRGWSESVQTLYPALDLLLIPSRCEGVPLVMLEALAHKVPVAGTDRDGMKVWLRPEWRFKVGDGEGMKQAVLSALQQDETEEFWRATNDHLEYIHDRKRFAREFFEAINSLA